MVEGWLVPPVSLGMILDFFIIIRRLDCSMVAKFLSFQNSFTKGYAGFLRAKIADILTFLHYYCSFILLNDLGKSFVMGR